MLLSDYPLYTGLDLLVEHHLMYAASLLWQHFLSLMLTCMSTLVTLYIPYLILPVSNYLA